MCYSASCVSVRLSVRPSVRLSVRSSVRLSVRPSVRSSFCLSVRPSVHDGLSVHPPVGHSVRRSIQSNDRPSVGHVLSRLQKVDCRYRTCLCSCDSLVGLAARVGTCPEIVGTVQIFSLMSRVSTCLNKDSTNVPTFKLTWNYLKFESKANIGISIDILSCQLDASKLNNRTSFCYRCNCRVNIITWNGYRSDAYESLDSVNN